MTRASSNSNVPATASPRSARLTPALAPWAFLAPFLLLAAVFVLYPLASSAPLATQRTFGPGARVPVGLDNFRDIFTDPTFYLALRNTVVYTLGSLFIQLPLALALAIVLNTPGLVARGLYRLIFFSPQLMGLVFVSILAGLAFEKRAGLVNLALNALTAGAFSLDFPWLESFVMPVLILISLWMYTGFNMIYFLAALQAVDSSVVEAAAVDGAGPWRRFLNVTVPAIRPVASFVVLLSLVGSLQLFELPYVLLDNSGGPRNQGLTLVMYLYQTGFESGDLGYASALGWVLAAGLLVLALLHLGLTGRAES